MLGARVVVHLSQLTYGLTPERVKKLHRVPGQSDALLWEVQLYVFSVWWIAHVATTDARSGFEYSGIYVIVSMGTIVYCDARYGYSQTPIHACWCRYASCHVMSNHPNYLPYYFRCAALDRLSKTRRILIQLFEPPFLDRSLDWVLDVDDARCLESVYLSDG